MSIKVFGHLNPDTDSVCSAIVASFLLNKLEMPAEPFVLGALNKETQFVLDTFKVATPSLLSSLDEGEEYALVDTTNPGELFETWNKGKLVAVFDHHKLAGVTSSDPLWLRAAPVACTATVLYQAMKENDLVKMLPTELAGLMLAAIVSDTLNFTSPTTTPVDKQIAAELELIAGTTADELAHGMFEAKSDLSGFSATDLLLLDSKVSDFNGKKVRLSSLETTKPANALAMLEQFHEAIASEKATGTDAVFLFVVDILRSEATLIVSGDLEREMAEKAFGCMLDVNGTAVLPGVVSRKKQIVPPLEKAFAN